MLKYRRLGLVRSHGGDEKLRLGALRDRLRVLELSFFCLAFGHETQPRLYTVLLYCTMLHYAVLCGTVLCYAVLCCSML